jgi:hypothetical protein
MTRFDPGQDGFVAATFAILLVMLAAGLTGAHQWFAYGLVALCGVFIGRGFVRRGKPVTWGAAGLATSVLFFAMAGILRNEGVIVDDVTDTVGGFHPGTAFLVYGIWIPALFTLGIGFALLFNTLESSDSQRTGTDGQEVTR